MKCTTFLFNSLWFRHKTRQAHWNKNKATELLLSFHFSLYK